MNIISEYLQGDLQGDSKDSETGQVNFIFLDW